MLLLALVAFYWKITLTKQYSWANNPEGAYQLLPWFQFQAGQWRHGHFPLWDPHEGGGQPLLGLMQPGAAYPLNWLLFLAPLRNGFVRLDFLNWYLVLIHFMGALFCYLLCRDLGRSRAASAVAGVVFSAGGFMGSLDRPQILNGGVWAPLVFLFVLRAGRGERPLRSAVLAGTFLGISFLSGDFQIPILVSLASGALWLFFLLHDRKAFRFVAIFAVFVLLTSGFQTLPAYQYAKLSVGAGSTNPLSVGIALVLAAMGLAAAWRERPVRIFAITGLGGLVFSFGAPMAIFLFHFSAAVLCAYGVDAGRPDRRAVVGLAIFSAILYFSLAGCALAQIQRDWNPVAMTALVALLASLCLLAWRRGQIGHPTAAALLAGIMMLDFAVRGPNVWPPVAEPQSCLNKLAQHADIAEFLRSRRGPVRFSADSAQIPYNFGDWFGIDQARGTWNARMLLGVNYTAGQKPERREQIEMFASASGLKLYLNLEAFPRVWTVHTVYPGGSLAQPLAELRRGTFVPGTAPALETCDSGEDTVTVSGRSAARLAANAEMRCRGMLIFGEAFDPGWRGQDGWQTGDHLRSLWLPARRGGGRGKAQGRDAVPSRLSHMGRAHYRRGADRRRGSGEDRPVTRAVAVPALLFLAIAGFYWKLTLTSRYTWLDSPDLANQVLPWWQFQATEWHQGHFPMWDPRLWGGQTLFGQAQPGAAYPLNWLLFLVPLDRGFIRLEAINWYFVITHFLAALFCYWLCRDLGRSHAASALAGFVFALGGWMGSNDWPQMFGGAVWAPLVFLFLLRAGRGGRRLTNAALAGTFLGVAFLSGHHQIPIFIGLACAGVWLYYIAHDRRALSGFVVFAIFSLMAGGFQLLPAYEYGKLAVRWSGTPEPLDWKTPVPYSIHEKFGLPPLSVLGLVIPGVWRNANPYVGATALMLAISAVAWSWKERAVRTLGVCSTRRTALLAGGVRGIAGCAVRARADGR